METDAEMWQRIVNVMNASISDTDTARKVCILMSNDIAERLFYFPPIPHGYLELRSMAGERGSIRCFRRPLLPNGTILLADIEWHNRY